MDHFVKIETDKLQPNDMSPFHHLPKGGTIAIVAPSGYIDPILAQKAIEQIEGEGYRVKVMPHVFNCRTSVFAASDENRASDLYQAITDDNIDAIICARGGYGAVRTLEHLPEGALEKCRKWLVGFSDITAIHSRLTHYGTPSLHGPMLKHIANHGMHANDVEMLFSIMRGETPKKVSIAPNELNRLGKASGTMKGGNLSLIYSLRATPADIDPRGAIVFIEDLSEYRYHIDRMMQNLAYSGFLSKLSGLIVGQFTDQKDGATPFRANAYEIVAQATAAYDYPVVFGYPAGHASDINMPLIMGCNATLEATPKGAFVEWKGCE